MTTSTPKQWLDLFLRDIAEKVQLSPTDYKKAQEHYRVMGDWISDSKSAIAAYSPYIYPHGSFRTQSTTAANSDRDDFDVDCMLELAIDPHSEPEEVLKVVYSAIDRGPGTRYHGLVSLKRRCVRVQYENMHLDLTPSVLIDRTNPRESSIFDTHPDRPDQAIANPEGFALWFDRHILPMEVLKRNYAMNDSIANSRPVPEQQPLEDKPAKLIALQLIKRYKDICYTDQPREKPPSVLIAYLVAGAPLPTASLIDTLQATVRFLMARLSNYPLIVENPASPEDMLTDRWPKSAHQQNAFSKHLEGLDFALSQLQRDTDLATKRNILRALFGEKVTNRSFDDISKKYEDSIRSGTLRTISGSAAIVPPGTKNVTYGTSIKAHTNFGDDIKPDEKTK